MQKIKNDEFSKYHSLPRTQFPNQCPVCDTNFRFASDFYLLSESDDQNVVKTVHPLKQTYYVCKCLNQNHAWLAYTQGAITETLVEEDRAKDILPVYSIELGYSLVNYALFSEFYGFEGVTDEINLYHHQHRTDNELIYFRVPIDEIILTPYIKKVTVGNSKLKDRLEIQCKKIMELGISLSLLSIMNFHNPASPALGRWVLGNLHSWLGFETEIKDLFIYSGAMFWEHTKKSFMYDSVIICVELIQSHFSNLNKALDITNLKAARDQFVAHFDVSGNNETTRGYIKTLYSAFNGLVKEFNRRYNQTPYSLNIGFEEFHYNLPTPNTPYDNALRHILRIINSQYEQHIEQANQEHERWERYRQEFERE